MLLVENATVYYQENRFKGKTLTVADSAWAAPPRQTAKAQVYHTGEAARAESPDKASAAEDQEARPAHLSLWTRSLPLLTTLCLLAASSVLTISGITGTEYATGSQPTSWGKRMETEHKCDSSILPCALINHLQLQ